MLLTIIVGDLISSLEVAPDMELENFLALCKVELPLITDIPTEKLVLNCSGRRIVPDSISSKKNLGELNIQDGDAIQFGAALPMQTSARAPIVDNSSNVTTPASTSSGLIANLINGIAVPKKAVTNKASDKDRMMSSQLFDMLADPHRLDFMREEHPSLAAAYEANPADREAFHAAFLKDKEEQAKRIKMMYDPTSVEGQRHIMEHIERERIQWMQEQAMEHMPEMFIPVHMLYIHLKINNHPIIAFVDSGAQSSILSESCARRCDVLRYVDKRIRVQAVGVGGAQKMLGRIHSCQMQVKDKVFESPFEVMADRDIDILFGLNTMLRHKCCIDLAKMVLRFGDGTETPFLNEADVEREKNAIRMEEDQNKN